MELSEIINLALGGGLVATVVAVITLKSTVRKAKAEAEKALADAEAVRIDNTEKATRILIENIVTPLKEELNETRKDLNATKREMARLRKAIDDASGCRYSDNCPVLKRMRIEQKKREPATDNKTRDEPSSQGQHCEDCPEVDNSCEDTLIKGKSNHSSRQSSHSSPQRSIHSSKGTSQPEGK